MPDPGHFQFLSDLQNFSSDFLWYSMNGRRCAGRTAGPLNYSVSHRIINNFINYSIFETSNIMQILARSTPLKLVHNFLIFIFIRISFIRFKKRNEIGVYIYKRASRVYTMFGATPYICKVK